MSSFHEVGGEYLAREMMRDSACAPVLAETQEKLQRRMFDPAYVAVIGQADPRAGRWPIEQAACFLHVHAGLNGGTFARVDIDLLEIPSADSERAQNASVIEDLPYPFVGSVDMHQGTSASGDGQVRWNSPIVARRSTGLCRYDDAGDAMAIFEDYHVRAWDTTNNCGLPLEIGSSKASVTAAHLARYGGVARWPYGSTVLTILLNTRAFSVAAGQQEAFAL